MDLTDLFRTINIRNLKKTYVNEDAKNRQGCRVIDMAACMRNVVIFVLIVMYEMYLLT